MTKDNLNAMKLMNFIYSVYPECRTFKKNEDGTYTTIFDRLFFIQFLKCIKVQSEFYEIDEDLSVAEFWVRLEDTVVFCQYNDFLRLNGKSQRGLRMQHFNLETGKLDEEFIFQNPSLDKNLKIL